VEWLADHAAAIGAIAAIVTILVLAVPRVREGILKVLTRTRKERERRATLDVLAALAPQLERIAAAVGENGRSLHERIDELANENRQQTKTLDHYRDSQADLRELVKDNWHAVVNIAKWQADHDSVHEREIAEIRVLSWAQDQVIAPMADRLLQDDEDGDAA
jgi:hypothetical protein